jgi:hypothetical protein
VRIEQCCNIKDFRLTARRRLPGPIFHYIDGAADDEVTYRRNTEAYERCDLVPNVLAGVESIDTIGDQLFPWATSSTRCATLNCRRHGSRIFGAQNDAAETLLLKGRAVATAGSPPVGRPFCATAGDLGSCSVTAAGRVTHPPGLDGYYECLLDSTDVQGGRSELHLLPTQAQCSRPCL